MSSTQIMAEQQQTKEQNKGETAEQFEEQIRKNKKTLSEHERIKLLVVRVCEDSPNTFALSVQKLADQILEYSQKAEKLEYVETMIRYFVDAVSLLHLKQAVYATVLALVFLKSREVFDLILKRITLQLQSSLNVGEKIKAKNLLVFLGELVNLGVVNCYSYEQVLSQILEECKKCQLQKEREYYLFVVLGSLGFVQKNLKQKIEVEYQQLLERIESLMQQRDLNYLQMFCQKGYKDRLTVLWQALNREEATQENNSSELVWRISEQFQKELNDIQQAELNLQLYFKNKSNCYYQSTLMISALLVEADSEQQEEEEMEEEQEEDEDEGRIQRKRGSDKKRLWQYTININRLLLCEGIQEMLELFSESKKNLLQQIQTLLRVSTSDQMSQLIFAVVADQLISEAVRPREASSAKRVILFSSVFHSLYTIKKEESEQLLFELFNETYKKTEQYLYSDSNENLGEFISHVLSERYQEFNWQSVSDGLQGNKQREFFWKDVIFRLCQLCGRDKIKSTFEALNQTKENALLQFIPLQTVKETISTRFQNTELSKRLMERLVQKKTSEEILKEIREYIGQLNMNEEYYDEEELEEDKITGRAVEVIETFVECLLVRSCETVTHLKILHERYQSLLNTLNNDYQQVFQETLVQVLLNFWKHSQFHLTLYINKFAGSGLLTNSLVAEIIFSEIERTNSTNQVAISQLWQSLRRLADNAAETHFNQTQQSPQTLNQEQTQTELKQLLDIIFTQFQECISTLKEKQLASGGYIPSFLLFYRKYSSIVNWKQDYAAAFAKLPIPHSVIKA